MLTLDKNINKTCVAFTCLVIAMVTAFLMLLVYMLIQRVDAVFLERHQILVLAATLVLFLTLSVCLTIFLRQIHSAMKEEEEHDSAIPNHIHPSYVSLAQV